VQHRVLKVNMSVFIEDDTHSVQDLQFVKKRLAHKIHECNLLEVEADRLSQLLQLKDNIIDSLRFEKSTLQDRILELKTSPNASK
jgi:hypothetical protein